MSEEKLPVQEKLARWIKAHMEAVPYEEKIKEIQKKVNVLRKEQRKYEQEIAQTVLEQSGKSVIKYGKYIVRIEKLEKTCGLTQESLRRNGSSFFAQLKKEKKIFDLPPDDITTCFTGFLDDRRKKDKKIKYKLIMERAEEDMFEIDKKFPKKQIIIKKNKKSVGDDKRKDEPEEDTESENEEESDEE